jgi:hypothetical protein
MKKAVFLSLWAACAVFILSCKSDAQNDKPQPSKAVIRFKFKFDPNQERLGNLGEPSPLKAGNAGISPVFNGISAHYYELAPDKYTALGKGVVLYHAPETKKGGDVAIDFSKSAVVKEGETAFSIPVSEVKPGKYEFLRVSLAYQNYDVSLKYESMTINGTLASFIGYNSYIESVKVKNQTLSVNANKKQGFWAFETPYNLTQGQAPATTVPNPIFATSPVPPGSCVVTAAFDKVLEITGKEDKDIEITMSLSVNKSFEWVDVVRDGVWEPAKGENVVDMGVRGMKVFVK